MNRVKSLQKNREGIYWEYSIYWGDGHVMESNIYIYNIQQHQTLEGSQVNSELKKSLGGR